MILHCNFDLHFFNDSSIRFQHGHTLNPSSIFNFWTILVFGFPGGSEVKASASNAGDLGSIPGSGRLPGEGNGNPLQYSCLENLTDRGTWGVTVHGVAKELDTTEAT